MRFPKEIALCRWCTHAEFIDIMEIAGHVQSCGQYNNDKCSLDNKKCKVIKYKKEK